MAATSTDTREADIRRRAIDATRALAETGGYDSVQMRDVVRLSRLSSATIYRHFSSKDHLLAATHLEWIRRLERSRAARPRGSDAVERVGAILHSTCRAMARRPRLAEALVHALGSRDEGVADCHREINAIMHEMFRTAVGDAFPDVDEFIRLLGVAWEGALFSWAFGRMTMDDVEATVRRCAALLIAGATAEADARAHAEAEAGAEAGTQPEAGTEAGTQPEAGTDAGADAAADLAAAPAAAVPGLPGRRASTTPADARTAAETESPAEPATSAGTAPA